MHADTVSKQHGVLRQVIQYCYLRAISDAEGMDVCVVDIGEH